MSQAEELLNGMSDEIPVHTHPVPDTDTYFVIDPITRKIENTNRKKSVIMQYDHNSERFTFGLPRYIDGHDMLECTSITVNVDNIEVVETEGVEDVVPRVNSDAPDLTDLRINPTDSEKVIVSWLISRNSTQLAGILSFHIEFKCVDSNGNVVYEWGTDNFDEITVKARKKNGAAAVLPYSDTLEQWRARIFGAGDSVMTNIEAEGKAQVTAVKAESETQQEAVELKGAQTLDTIPEDYTEVNAMAEEAVRSKGDAIVCDAAGKSIVLKDSSNDHIRGLKLYGKSIQDGDPTPDNPVEIVSIENSNIRICGKNLVCGDVTRFATMNNGITINVTEGSSDFLLGGTQNGTTNASAFLVRTMLLYPGTYTLSVYGLVGSDYINIKQLSGDQHYLFVAATEHYPKTFTVDQTVEIGVEIVTNMTSSYNKTVVKLQLEHGTAVTEYEPYKPVQSVIIPHTLPGIPVTSGGNYTDSDGQQWICDEIDLERGVYVQRIKNVLFDGDENWYQYGLYENGAVIYSIYSTEERPVKEKKQLSNILNFNWTIGDKTPQNSFAIGATGGVYAVLSADAFPDVDDWKARLTEHNMNVQYILNAPIETPLTAEEIVAFKTLRTNYPNTTILNDAGAWMSVKYNADTKTYVANPKTLKLVDSSTGVIYELKIVDGNLTVVPV